jgi:hypothetical protein
MSGRGRPRGDPDRLPLEDKFMLIRKTTRLLILGSARRLTRGKGGEFVELQVTHRYELALE